MKPLRILVVADMTPDRNSGAAGVELEVADELERQGHEVVRRWGDSFPHRIRHWNLYHLLEQPRAIAAVVERETARREFDVIQVAQPAGWLAARAHRRANRPGIFVHRSHGYEPRFDATVKRWAPLYGEDRRSVSRRAATSVLRKLLARNYRGIEKWADLHVVSCTECRDWLVGSGVAARRVIVSPHGTGEEFLRSPISPLDDERRLRLLWIGHHSFIKGPMIGAAVVERILSEEPNVGVTWLCEPAAFDSVRARFGAAVHDRLELAAWRPRVELPDLFDRHGLFLFASFAEGFGKTLVEAMARGLAVVSTDQGAAHDLVVDGANGLLAPVGDVEALVSRLRRLLHDSGLARRIAVAGRATAERWTWRRVASALADDFRVHLESGSTE